MEVGLFRMVDGCFYFLVYSIFMAVTTNLIQRKTDKSSLMTFSGTAEFGLPYVLKIKHFSVTILEQEGILHARA